MPDSQTPARQLLSPNTYVPIGALAVVAAFVWWISDTVRGEMKEINDAVVPRIITIEERVRSMDDAMTELRRRSNGYITRTDLDQALEVQILRMRRDIEGDLEKIRERVQKLEVSRGIPK